MYGNMISNFTYSGIQVGDGSVATIGGNNDSNDIGYNPNYETDQVLSILN